MDPMTLAPGTDPAAWLILLAILIWFDRARWMQRFRGARRSSFRYRRPD
jgi:hypothetical protein